MTWRRHAARLLAATTLATAMLGASARAAHAPLLEEHASDHIHFPSYVAPFLSCLPEDLPAYAFPSDPGRVPSTAEAWGDAANVSYSRVPEKAWLIERQIAVESDYHAHAVSDVGAVGLLQIMPLTGEWLGRRVASEEEVSCILEASGRPVSGGYVAGLKGLSAAAEEGAVPYAFLSRFDERFDPVKNVHTGLDYHLRFGLGRLPDSHVFLTYIAGPGNVANGTNIGSASRGYYPKILRTDPRDFRPSGDVARSSL